MPTPGLVGTMKLKEQPKATKKSAVSELDFYYDLNTLSDGVNQIDQSDKKFLSFSGVNTYC